MPSNQTLAFGAAALLGLLGFACGWIITGALRQVRRSSKQLELNLDREERDLMRMAK